MRTRLRAASLLSSGLAAALAAFAVSACNATLLNIGDKDVDPAGAPEEAPAASASSAVDSPDSPAANKSAGKSPSKLEASSTWTTLTPPGAGFHVDFPDKHIDKEEPVDVAGKTASMHAWFGKSSHGSIFTAAYARMSGDDTTLHAFVQSIATGCGGAVGQEVPVKLGPREGLRVTIQCKGKVFYLGRVFRTRAALYSIGMMTTWGRISSNDATQEAAKFFDSLAIDEK